MAIDEIDPELCNGCGMCVNSCPMDVIRMDGKSRKAIIKYPEDCMFDVKLGVARSRRALSPSKLFGRGCEI